MRQIRRRVFTAALTIVLSLILLLPSYAAIYNFPYPTAENKKGLMIGDDMVEDALELNICHATFNFPITHMIAYKSECNSSKSYSFKYKGKKYWFRKEHIHAWDSVLQKLKQNNVIVTGILLVDKRSDLKNLIYPSARGKKAGYYAWNMDGKENQRQIEAAISFLARRYTNSRHGRVVGWIVGNEINSASDWNRAGNVSFSEYMDLYARMFEKSSEIIHGVYANARMYVPLDHFWNISYGGVETYRGRDCLDTFAARMRLDGYKWNLAYHAYNGDMNQPSITDPQKYGTTNDLNTPIITMKNLSVLTNYIRNTYGEGTRIILSEQGYSSLWNGANVSAQQSESVALSYYLAMADPMVDSFIYYTQVDQNLLTKVGSAYGLWKVSRKEKATSKKPSWSVYKYMDTDQSTEVLDRARSLSGQMTGQTPSATRTIRQGTQIPCGKYRLRLQLKKGWNECGGVRSIQQKDGRYRLIRDSSRNVNVYWGLQKKFGNLNVSAKPHLCLTISGGRLTGGETQLLVRIFSGNRNLFEASGTIISKKTQCIRIDLGDWPGQSSITKIQILIKRETGKWPKNAEVVIGGIGFA